MYSVARVSVTAAFFTALLTLAAGASAQTYEKSAGGHLYATGAVTAEELRTLAQEKDKYSLWVTTAAKGSGAYLSDAAVKITDAKKDVVLDTVVVGPWLLIDLPPGTYTIETTFRDQTQKRTARIGRGSRANQMVLYFDSPAEVSPDWVSPFKDDPYSGK